MKKILTAFLVLFFVSPVFANRDHDMDDQDMMAKEKKIDEIAAELGLTPDQKAKLQTSRDKYKPQIQDKEAVYKAAEEKFTATINNPNATSSELQTLFQQKLDARNALHQVYFQSRMEFRDILTPEQRTKMLSKRDQSKDKMRTKHEGWKDYKKEKRMESPTTTPSTVSPAAPTSPPATIQK